MEINYKQMYMCLILLNIQLIINMVCYVFGNATLIWNEATKLIYSEVLLSLMLHSYPKLQRYLRPKSWIFNKFYREIVVTEFEFRLKR